MSIKNVEESLCGEDLSEDIAGSWKEVVALMEHKRVIMIQFLKGCSPKRRTGNPGTAGTGF